MVDGLSTSAASWELVGGEELVTEEGQNWRSVVRSEEIPLKQAGVGRGGKGMCFVGVLRHFEADVPLVRHV